MKNASWKAHARDQREYERACKVKDKVISYSGPLTLLEKISQSLRDTRESKKMRESTCEET